MRIDTTATIERLERAAADLASPIKNRPTRGFFAVAAGSGPWPCPPNEETFADKLRAAVKARTAQNSVSQKEHAEYVERENARYRPLQRRPHGLGE
jgi:hypothetical protein